MFETDYKRVIYAKAPITEVSCQLRFPAILKIENESPSAFQELIRDKFPLYEKEANSDLPEGLIEVLPADLVKSSETLSHVFDSSDRHYSIELSGKSLIISTDTYSTWKAFKDVWKFPFEAFDQSYKPPFLNYLALKYQDVIDRTALGFAPGTPWYELIKPGILGELADERAKHIEYMVCIKQLVIKLPDGTGLLGIRHGLGGKGSEKGVEESVYIIESTFFINERTELKNAEAILDSFNSKAGSFFRWCITDKLHEAMGPQQQS